MKITAHTIAQLRDATTRRAICDTTDLVADSCLAIQTENPRAHADDVALLMAEHEGRVVGTLGVLPDWIHLGSERLRFGWLHNWNATTGSGGAGALLLLTAARHYRDSVGVSGCTPIAEKIYLGSRKFVAHEKRGASFFFRADLAHQITTRAPRLSVALPAVRAAERMLNVVLSSRLTLWNVRSSRVEATRSVRLREIDAETARFIESVRWPELFRRGAPELNWMQRFAGSAAPSTWSPGARQRTHSLLRVHDAIGDVVAVVYATLFHGTMKVPYYFCRPESIDVVAGAVLRECARRDVRDVLVYSEGLANAFVALGAPSYTHRQRSKPFLLSKRLTGSLEPGSFTLQDGDGDAFL